MSPVSLYTFYKLNYFFLSLILFLFSTSNALWSQNRTNNAFFQRELRFSHFDISDGLSNNYVNSVAQDSIGFLWIATIAGLNRYDGTNFKVFTQDNSGLENNYINQVYNTNQGLLYLATNGGVQTYKHKTDSFEVFTRQNSTLSNSISAIVLDDNKQIIVGDYGRGIHIFDHLQELKFKFEKSSLSPILGNIRIAALALQGDSILWAGTYDEGLYKITFSNKEQPFRIEHIFSERTNAILIDSQNTAWFGTDSGLKAITAVGDTILIDKGKGNHLSDATIKALEEDKNGFIWIGTRNGGLNVLDPNSLNNSSKNPKIRQFAPKNDGSSVYHRDITSLECDASGNMWIGTGAGLDFVNPEGEIVILVNSRNHNSKELAYDRISALEMSKNGKIWVGTDGGGFDLYDTKSEKIINFSKENTAPGLSNNFIVSLLEDSANNLWVGTYRGGLNKLNLKTKKWERYLQGAEYDGSDVRVIFEDIEGGIWAGTNRGGFYRYDETENIFEYISGLGKIDIRDIEQVEKGKLWLATYGNGLVHFDTQTKDFKGFSTANADFRTNIIFNIAFLDPTHLLLGTLNEGLIKFDLTS